MYSTLCRCAGVQKWMNVEKECRISKGKRYNPLCSNTSYPEQRSHKHTKWHTQTHQQILRSHYLRKSNKNWNFGKWPPQNLLSFGYSIHLVTLVNFQKYFHHTTKMMGFMALYFLEPKMKNEISSTFNWEYFNQPIYRYMDVLLFLTR